ncbi:gp53 baseplate wedge subunit [Acinetobacter phage Ac42]|uniref:baseplate wedge subunit n=1 Tax=Acinetobacter phage Ac42 TaxID=762660 RepID=UPI0001EBCD76|nr:baseplate wedge subunit [Acinetobacter phage Ac42]ADI96397.1 gp53 baseplate wedge subunit [Acinetobacter phage Ac42]
MLLSFYDPISYTAKTVNKNAKPVLMTQIFRDYKEYFDRVAVNYRLISYYIQDAPRPETLANELYGNVQLYWVLLMCNNIYDPFHGWIKSQEAVYDSVEQEYDEPEQVVYHVDVKGEKYFNLVEYPLYSGIWYDKGDKNRLHRQYTGALRAVDANEAALLNNEAKRKIKIIAPSDIDAFLADFIKEMERN